MSPISAPAGAAALAFENFLAVSTINFLQQRLGLHLPRNRTERLGALRAPDAINYIDTPALFEKAVAAANGKGVQCDAEMAGAAPSQGHPRPSRSWLQDPCRPPYRSAADRAPSSTGGGRTSRCRFRHCRAVSPDSRWSDTSHGLLVTKSLPHKLQEMAFAKGDFLHPRRSVRLIVNVAVASEICWKIGFSSA